MAIPVQKNLVATGTSVPVSLTAGQWVKLAFSVIDPVDGTDVVLTGNKRVIFTVRALLGFASIPSGPALVSRAATVTADGACDVTALPADSLALLGDYGWDLILYDDDTHTSTPLVTSSRLVVMPTVGLPTDTHTFAVVSYASNADLPLSPEPSDGAYAVVLESPPKLAVYSHADLAWFVDGAQVQPVP